MAQAKAGAGSASKKGGAVTPSELRTCLHAPSPAPESWRAFIRMLERKGRARVAVASTLRHEGLEVGHFEGEFVALGTSGN